MSATTQFQVEKAELDAVLGSGIFNRAPGLENFLRYVCQKYFDGQADQIKEYNIAVEALGRPPEFDQRKDSIVRVEAHRLRKRLREFYAGAGADHPLQIVIPQGQYIPRFVLRDADQLVTEPDPVPALAPQAIAPPAADWPIPSQTALADGAESLVPAAAEVLVQPAAVSRRWWWIGLGVALVAGLAAVWVWQDGARTSVQNANIAPISAGTELRILSGHTGAPFTDQQGRVWQADRFFEGGLGVRSTHLPSIHRTQDPEMFRSHREGTFRYEIPLQPGIYELHLFFAETVYGEGNSAGGGETSRLFDVKLNGQTVLTTFDVLSDAGAANTVEEKVFKDVSPGADGKLRIEFAAVGYSVPFVNAIMVLPGIPGKIRPIRITTRHTPFTDREGRLWEADHYYLGGQAIQRRESAAGTRDPQLYSGERYGNFSYSIPVPPGRYGVTLKFVENYFGPDNPGQGGIASRLFDVFCNGIALLRNFDIFQQANGSNRTIDKVFHGLQPNAQGKLVFQFVPVRNYACLSAIEVIDESE